MKCKNCNYEIIENTNKCPACGYNLGGLNSQQNVLTQEQQNEISKSIGKVILLFTFIPLIPFVLSGIIFLLIWLVSEKILTILDIIVGIKYVLIVLSVICFGLMISNISNRSNKKVTNIILGILGTIFIAPVIFFSVFIKINVIDAKDSIKINNYSIPTLYQNTQYDDSFITFQTTINDTTSTGDNIKADCVISFYYQPIANQYINLYKQKLMQLGYEYETEYKDEYSDESESNFVKVNKDDFIIISVGGAQVSYCLIEGNYANYKGEW